MSTTDRTVLSHPSTVPSPPDEARRLQPHTKLHAVPVPPPQAPIQACRHLLRGAHRGIDRRVALQRGAECCELLAEAVQRFAAIELNLFILRVPPQGAQQRVRHGLRRQTRQSRAFRPSRAFRQSQALQQPVQRARGSPRSLRVWASRAFSFFASLGIRFDSKDQTFRKNVATPTYHCSLVALNMLVESRFECCPAGPIEMYCHGGISKQQTPAAEVGRNSLGGVVRVRV